jgi:molybdopterin converting factor small subunit
MLVKIAKIGSRVNEVALGDEATVQDALTAGGQPIPSGHELRVNGERATSSTELEDGDVITLVPSIKGGN